MISYFSFYYFTLLALLEFGIGSSSSAPPPNRISPYNVNIQASTSTTTSSVVELKPFANIPFDNRYINTIHYSDGNITFITGLFIKKIVNYSDGNNNDVVVTFSIPTNSTLQQGAVMRSNALAKDEVVFDKRFDADARTIPLKEYVQNIGVRVQMGGVQKAINLTLQYHLNWEYSIFDITTGTYYKTPDVGRYGTYYDYIGNKSCLKDFPSNPLAYETQAAIPSLATSYNLFGYNTVAPQPFTFSGPHEFTIYGQYWICGRYYEGAWRWDCGGQDVVGQKITAFRWAPGEPKMEVGGCIMTNGWNVNNSTLDNGLWYAEDCVKTITSALCLIQPKIETPMYGTITISIERTPPRLPDEETTSEEYLDGDSQDIRRTIEITMITLGVVTPSGSLFSLQGAMLMASSPCASSNMHKVANDAEWSVSPMRYVVMKINGNVDPLNFPRRTSEVAWNGILLVCIGVVHGIVTVIAYLFIVPVGDNALHFMYYPSSLLFVMVFVLQGSSYGMVSSYVQDDDTIPTNQLIGITVFVFTVLAALVGLFFYVRRTVGASFVFHPYSGDRNSKLWPRGYWTPFTFAKSFGIYYSEVTPENAQIEFLVSTSRRILVGINAGVASNPKAIITCQSSCYTLAVVDVLYAMMYFKTLPHRSVLESILIGIEILAEAGFVATVGLDSGRQDVTMASQITLWLFVLLIQLNALYSCLTGLRELLLWRGLFGPIPDPNNDVGGDGGHHLPGFSDGGGSSMQFIMESDAESLDSLTATMKRVPHPHHQKHHGKGGSGIHARGSAMWLGALVILLTSGATFVAKKRRAHRRSHEDSVHMTELGPSHRGVNAINTAEAPPESPCGTLPKAPAFLAVLAQQQQPSQRTGAQQLHQQRVGTSVIPPSSGVRISPKALNSTNRAGVGFGPGGLPPPAHLMGGGTSNTPKISPKKPIIARDL
eukprot:PhF_6_TR27192/c2_g1_i1/m.39956